MPTFNHDAEFLSTCQAMLATFFSKFPDDAHRDIASRVLKKLSEDQRDYDGAPGGWAGGIVHSTAKYSRLDLLAVINPEMEATIGDLHSSHTPPVALNADMEAVFGAPMGTIRKRAEELWRIVSDVLTEGAPSGDGEEEISTKDEAKAILWFMFGVCGIGERCTSTDSDGQPHVSKSDPRRWKAEATAALAYVLDMKKSTPVVYRRFIRSCLCLCGS